MQRPESSVASRRVQVDIIGDRDSRVSTSSEAGSLPDNKEGRDGSREGSGSDAWSSLEAGRERNRKAAPSDPGSTAASASPRYRTIVADPPWRVRDFSPGGGGGRGPGWQPGTSKPMPYPTMTLDELATLEIPAASDAHLYLWTINCAVEAAYDLTRAWGFKPSTLLTWCKAPNGIGLGGTFALSSEFVLFARRGRLPSLSRVERSWFDWPRGRHSAKPEAFLDLVERVSPAPRLEMFARRNRLGWDTWGDQALEHVELTA